MNLVARFKDWRHDYYPEIAALQHKRVIPAKVKSMWSDSGIDPAAADRAYNYLQDITIWVSYHPRKFKREDMERVRAKVEEMLAGQDVWSKALTEVEADA